MTARSAQPSDAQQSRYPSLVVELPAWVAEFVPPPEHVYATVEERMELAVELSRANVARGTGGPFVTLRCSIIKPIDWLPLA